MKTKLFIFFLALASVEMMYAEKVQIGDLYYNLDADNQTAEVTSQNDYWAYWSTKITTADIPASVIYNDVTYSVTSIGENAFNMCMDLTSVTIPNSVTSIGERAFAASGSLTSVTIGNGVTSIGEGAFMVCYGLISIEIPNSVTSIGNSAFNDCEGLVSVTIPNSVTSIGERAFYMCRSLTSVAIPNCVTSIEESTFDGCWNLTSIEIPNSVTSIGNDAFCECYKLTSITIPNSVTRIGERAFRKCRGLTSIKIPNSVTSIGDLVFFDCTGLTSMYVEEGNIVYDSRDNCNAIIETASKTLVAGCQNTIIPSSVISIGNYAFYGCTGFTSIELPNSITSIGSNAFYGCSGLTSITCEAIIPPTLGSGVFSGVGNSIPLYVPKESVELYKTTDQWKNFSVKSISESEEPELKTKEVDCYIRYMDKNTTLVSIEQLTFHVPEAPEFEGFTFVRWEFVGGAISDGLTIQAVYKADEPTSAPEVVTNSSNPAQKLIRNGSVYILTDDSHTYTLTGQQVK